MTGAGRFIPVPFLRLGLIDVLAVLAWQSFAIQAVVLLSDRATAFVAVVVFMVLLGPGPVDITSRS